MTFHESKSRKTHCGINESTINTRQRLFNTSQFCMFFFSSSSRFFRVHIKNHRQALSVRCRINNWPQLAYRNPSTKPKYISPCSTYNWIVCFIQNAVGFTGTIPRWIEIRNERVISLKHWANKRKNTLFIRPPRKEMKIMKIYSATGSQAHTHVTLWRDIEAVLKQKRRRKKCICNSWLTVKWLREYCMAGAQYAVGRLVVSVSLVWF